LIIDTINCIICIAENRKITEEEEEEEEIFIAKQHFSYTITNIINRLPENNKLILNYI